MEIYSLFVRNLDGKTLTFRFSQNLIDGETISNKIYAATKVPVSLQLLVTEGRHVYANTILHASSSPIFPTVHLLLRLAGGKGGFGSLLRGAGSKAGKKKTNNYDACRDLNGRRLRHVNAEKKLEEWQADAEERRLEKIANDFIKKNTKNGQKAREGEAKKYVAKYREESAKCVEVVEASVRETFKNSKRKLLSVLESDSRRLKLWNGKKKLDESDSEEESDDDNDEETQNNENGHKSVILVTGNVSDSSHENSDKSVILDNGNVSDSSPELDASIKSLNHPSDNPSPNSIPDEELHIPQNNSRSEESTPENEYSTQPNVELVDEQWGSSSTNTAEIKEDTGSDGGILEWKPLDFDEFHSPTDLEGIGMERLKIELQARGLKCGGTLQERAARLFLLKTTPMDLLPKKVLAKK